MATCENCGAQVRPNASRCEKCGSQVSAPATSPQQPMYAQGNQSTTQPQVVYVQNPAQVAGAAKSKVVAALLAFFLGAIGIHNFYLGYTGRGIAQLLLTLLTCGWGILITGVWALIEFVLILTGALKDKSGQELS